MLIAGLGNWGESTIGCHSRKVASGDIKTIYFACIDGRKLISANQYNSYKQLSPGKGQPNQALVVLRHLNTGSQNLLLLHCFSVLKAVEDAGLWRFCDPVRHYRFNI